MKAGTCAGMTSTASRLTMKWPFVPQEKNDTGIASISKTEILRNIVLCFIGVGQLISPVTDSGEIMLQNRDDQENSSGPAMRFSDAAQTESVRARNWLSGEG